jgi:hypothetical protein
MIHIIFILCNDGNSNFQEIQQDAHTSGINTMDLDKVEGRL